MFLLLLIKKKCRHTRASKQTPRFSKIVQTNQIFHSIKLTFNVSHGSIQVTYHYNVSKQTWRSFDVLWPVIVCVVLRCNQCSPANEWRFIHSRTCAALVCKAIEGACQYINHLCTGLQQNDFDVDTDISMSEIVEHMQCIFNFAQLILQL